MGCNGDFDNWSSQSMVCTPSNKEKNRRINGKSIYYRLDYWLHLAMSRFRPAVIKFNKQVQELLV